MKTTLPADFGAEVYDLVRQIPAGCVLNYGRIAQLVGAPCHARLVGRMLAAAPPDVPCHRVVGSDGRTAAGWSAQRTLLEAEGVGFRSNGKADLKHHLWQIAARNDPDGGQ